MTIPDSIDMNPLHPNVLSRSQKGVKQQGITLYVLLLYNVPVTAERFTFKIVDSDFGLRMF